MYRVPLGGPESRRTPHRVARTGHSLQQLVRSHEIQRRGFAVGPRTWGMPKRLKQRRRQTTRRTRGRNGRVRFRRCPPYRALVRHHLVRPDLGCAVHGHTGGGRRRTRRHRFPHNSRRSSRGASRCNDLGWMDKGTCYEPDVPAAAWQQPPDLLHCHQGDLSLKPDRPNMSQGDSDISSTPASPLSPELPGLGVITPSTISSTDVLQMSSELRLRGCAHESREDGGSAQPTDERGASLALYGHLHEWCSGSRRHGRGYGIQRLAARDRHRRWPILPLWTWLATSTWRTERSAPSP